MANIAVEQYLNEVYNKIIQYECKFPDEFYEICVLVSKRIVPTLENHGGFVYLKRDLFDCSHYIMGHRIILVDEDYIPSFDHSYYDTIKPVIVCKKSYVFPTEADVGDYVIYNNILRQISDVSYIDGDRTVIINDVYVRFNDFFDSIRFEDTTDTIRWISKGLTDVYIEDWPENPDTSAITEYFNSLTIT